MGCVSDVIVVRAIPDSELLIFWYVSILNFYFSDLEFVRRALVAPDAATAAGDLSPTLCVDRACPGLMLPFFG